MKRTKKEKENILQAKDYVDSLIELFEAIVEDFINDDSLAPNKYSKVLICQRALNASTAKLGHQINSLVLDSVASLIELDKIEQQIRRGLNGK